MADRFSDLDITKDELNAIGAALKDKEFVKLLSDYCAEVTDPENVKTYQNEMTILEKERGVDVTFINPSPGYVIKTSDGSRKVYLNVCYNDNVAKPTSETRNSGRVWSVPHVLAPPRDEFTRNDTKTAICTVYDVVFHPYTLYLASKVPQFREMVTTTALDSVESKFGLVLDRKNLKFPKLKFKGSGGRASVIRKKIEGFEKSDDGEEDLLEKMCPYPSETAQIDKITKQKSQPAQDLKSSYTTPIYEIKHRSAIDLQDFRQTMTCKLNATVPTDLIINIDLPLLNSTSDCQLDVTPKTLTLVSEKPAKYKLELQLPYTVNDQNGSAKFDKSKRRLTVTVPVVRKPTPVTVEFREDSGVESGPELVTEISETRTTSEVLDENKQNYPEIEKPEFLDPEVVYTFPEVTCNTFKNTLAFTLHVKNVEPASISKIVSNTTLQLKFTTLSTGFYPIHYSLYLKFEVPFQEPLIETWDNNVIIQIPFSETPDKYLIGSSEANLLEHSLRTKIDSDESSAEEVLVSTKYSDDEVTLDIADVGKKEKCIDIPSLRKQSSYSESSGDELSQSPGNAKAKGILKRRSRGLNRSVSESSVDEMTWPGSLDLGLSLGSDGCIPEEGVSGSSLKKTVRFNDHVSKQIFRMNSSILGQKKKNQRKNRNKKRSQERRYSESELSETEDKKEQFRKKPSHDRRAFSENELSETETYKKPALKQSVRRETPKIRMDPRARLDSSDTEFSEKSKNGAQVPELELDFKSDLIFDLDI